MKNPTTVVIGGSGMLGTSFVNKYQVKLNVKTIGRHPESDVICDCVNSRGLLRTLNYLAPEVIINFAAMTNVDLCSAYPLQCIALHHGINETIRRYIDDNLSSYAIGVSTDHVYDSANLSGESDISIKNTYAASKYIGEEVLLSGDRSVVFRTNFFGKSQHLTRKSFSDFLIGSFKLSDPVKLFDDVFFSPVPMQFLLDIIFRTSIDRSLIGCYNVGAEDQISKFEFGVIFYEHLGLSVQKLRPVHFDLIQKEKNLVNRPRGMGMNSNKLAEALGIELKTCDENIKSTIKEYTVG